MDFDAGDVLRLELALLRQVFFLSFMLLLVFAHGLTSRFRGHGRRQFSDGFE
jgi:hypothetical protein